MKLYMECQSCKKYFKLKKSFITRPDLIAELGEYFSLQCEDCLSLTEYHANDVEARDAISGNLLGTVIGATLMIRTTFFIWNQGFVTILGLLIGGGIIAASNLSMLNCNTQAFNSYKVRRNPKQ